MTLGMATIITALLTVVQLCGVAYSQAESPANNYSLCVVNCDVVGVSMPPVCASDGVTYGSDCLLLAMRCRNASIFKAHDGKCEGDANLEPTSEPPSVNDAFHEPTNTTTTTTTNSTTSDNTTLCLRSCNDVDRPLCGSDNTTYRNSCHFHNAQCGSGGTSSTPRLRVAHYGSCASAAVTLAPRPAFCDSEVQCTQAQRDYAPSCGSDGVTYTSDCAFKIAFCRHHTTLTLAYDGPCTPVL